LSVKYLFVLFIIIGQSFLFQNLNAQPFYIPVSLPDSIVPIDIMINDDNYLIILSQNGLFELHSEKLESISKFNDFDVTISNNYKSYVDTFFEYPIAQGGYLQLNRKTSDVKVNNGTLNDRNHLSSRNVKEYHLNKVISYFQMTDSTYYYMTDSDILFADKNITYDWEVPLLRHEELRGFTIDQNHTLYVITNQRIIIRPELTNLIIPLPTPETNNLYKIREKIYTTDKENVYQLNNNSWQIKTNLKAPKHISQESEIINLIYEGYIEKLSKKNARLLKRKAVITDESIQYILDQYTCTNLSLYKDDIKLNETDDHFYKVIINGDDVYALSATGIYEMQNNRLVKLLNSDISESQNHSIINGLLYYHNQGRLKSYDLEDETEINVNINKTIVHDILLMDDHVVTLTSKSIIYVHRLSLNRDRLSISHIIPLCDSISSGKLYIIDNKIWATTDKGIMHINKKVSRDITLPSVDAFVNRSNSDHLELKTNNYLTNKLYYTFYINSDGETKTIWNRSNEVSLSDMNGDIELIVKMNDDVYLQDIYSESITVKAGNRSVLNILIWICMTILTTLLFLWFYRSN